MKITIDQVRYVAGLANLSLNEDEIARMAHDLDEILSHMDKLNEIDTSNVEPMAQVLFEAGDQATLRADIERPTLSNEDALACAAISGSGYFKVPRVIEK
ncbi:MAG: Asp-tRNA(Asn)/Glu-tRNA(Gln) amidotransferase subunit GatC [Bryobacterales bacterium]|nr:Asp-tRNA(Asn)/Glu-tRNA(Gln) amidotransferase subunit GatC [Bryobacterales bacterium]